MGTWYIFFLLTEIKLLRLSAFINDVVKTRKIEDRPMGPPPAVVMKMDIEGSELEVFPDLLVTGGFRNVDKVFMEWHEAITSNREGRKELMKKVFESNAF